MDRPFTSYSGSGEEPFIFVSYAHEDAARVYPELAALHAAGFNIWYDEGISPGSSWRAELARAISNSSLFLYFVTPRSAASINCQKEVHFAIDADKPVLAIHLAPTTLPEALQLSLSDIQAILKHELPETDYQRKLLAGVTSHIQPAARQAPTETSTPVPEAPQKSDKSMLIVGIAIALAIVVGAWLLRSPDTAQAPVAATPGADLTVTPAAVDVGSEPSMVVLPFENQSVDQDNAFFTVGIHGDILSVLSKIPGLTVISRNSAMRYENTDKSIAQIGDELNVNHVLEGTVRRAGDRVRISVQLIEAATDRNIWSETYDRNLTDIFAIQSEVAQAIAKALSVTLDVATAKRISVEPVDSRAYDYYLKARTIINETPFGWDTVSPGGRGTIAIDLLRAAIDIEDFALAHSAIAEAYSLALANQWPLIRDKAISSAQKAVDAAPDSAESQLAMAMVLSHQSERQYELANPYFVRALELAPNDARALWLYGAMLIWQGRIDEAYRQWYNIVEVDPLSSEARLAQAELFRSQGQMDQARTEIEQALQLSPDSVTIHRAAAFSYWRMDQPTDRLRELKRAHEINGQDSLTMYNIVQALAEMGDYASAKQWVGRLAQTDPDMANLGAGYVFLRQDERQELIDVMAVAVAQNPENRFVQYFAAIADTYRAVEAEDAERYEDSRRFRGAAISRIGRLLAPDMQPSGEITIRLDNVNMVLSYALRQKSMGEVAAASDIARDVLDFYAEQAAYNVLDGHLLQAVAHALLEDYGSMAEELMALEAASYRDVGVFDAYFMRENFGVFDEARRNIVLQDVYERMKQRNEADLVDARAAVPDFFIGR